MSQHPPKHFPSIADVVREVEIALHKHPKAEYLTFSGNGEPTLHPKFSDIIVEIHKLRDKLRPGIKLAVFSNATTVTQPEIRDALTHFDMPILKLDVGDEEMFNRINHPAPTVHFADIAAGLKQIPNLITQTVFIDGKHNNSGGDAYEAWVNTLDAIHPTQAQIYSTDYPVPKTGVERVLPYKLKHIAEDVKKRANIPVQAYWLDY